MANALTTAKAFADAGDDAFLIFDGAGTRWVPVLESDQHRCHEIYDAGRRYPIWVTPE